MKNEYDHHHRPGLALRWLAWPFGMVAGNAIIGLLYVGTGFFFARLDGSDIAPFIGVPSLFLVPLIGGLVAAYVWRRLTPGIGATVLASLGLSVLGLVAATTMLHEGVICIIIASPLLFVLILAGALFGRIWFKVDPSTYRVSILPLLMVLAAAEPLARMDRTSVVVDEMLIHAPPAKVWPEVTAFPQIRQPPQFWLFRLGLPYPQATTSAGDFVGADRRCIFSGNAVFRETVVAWEPSRKLTFDIVGIPRDPELVGHLTPSRGEFLLRDNGDGTTTLIGSTWYTLHVRPLWYFDWWTRYIFREVHLRVMEDIRRRTEAS